MTDHPDPTALRLEGQRLVEAATRDWALSIADPISRIPPGDRSMRENALVDLAQATRTLLQSLAALTEERDRLRANAPLFAVHVIGPDDIWPMPDLETARQSAKKLNDWHFNRADKSPDDPSLYAVVTVYPHDADSHASGLANAAAEFGFTLTARPTP